MRMQHPPLNMFKPHFREACRRLFSSASPRCSGVLWKDEEVGRLRKYTDAKMSLKSIVTKFPGRSKDSVKGKLRNLGLYQSFRTYDSAGYKITKIPWTADQVARLQKCAQDNVDLNAMLAELPERHPASIIKKLSSLGLSYRHTREDPLVKSTTRPKWSLQEDGIVLAYMEDHLATKSTLSNPDLALLAKRLGRTPIGVANRMRRLKVQSGSTPTGRRSWTEKERRLLLQWHTEGVKLKIMGERLDRSELSVMSQLKAMRETEDFGPKPVARR